MGESEQPGLTPKQQQAVAALLSARDVQEAAKAVGVGRRTLHRWLAQDQAFRAALSAAEGDLLDQACRRLLQLQDTAIGTFEALLGDESSAADAVKLRAAMAVLDHLLKLRELHGVESRLAELEQRLADWESESRAARAAPGDGR